jgi:hypothetical protein
MQTLVLPVRISSLAREEIDEMQAKLSELEG